MEKFELRGLLACDIVPMFNILSKIGFKDLKELLTPERITNMMTVFNSSEKKEEHGSAVDMTTVFGFNMVFEFLEIFMKNIPACESDVNKFLANLSGKTEEEISNLPLVDFTEMVIAVIKKEEFTDFFKVVSKLFK